MTKKQRKIIHIDMDCFYASIEIRDKPHLRDKPVAVGGSAYERGVLSTCNYVARKYGLHSAMPTAQAFKKCPDLVLLPVNMPLYRQISQQIQQIFREYTDLVEPLSLDEAYLDVTDCTRCQGSATWIAEEIRQRIFKTTGLTASAGVAPLKFLAKIASDQNKPNGIFVIKPQDVDAFVHQLPLKKIPSVGKVTNDKLNQMGLHTCGDVQKVEQHLILSQFGKLGQRIWQFSHGLDSREVQPHRQRKSIGVERTVIHDFATYEQALPLLDELFDLLKKRIFRVSPHVPLQHFTKLSIKLKFDDFSQTTLEKTGLSFELESFRHLLTQIWQRSHGRAVRLIGVQVQMPNEVKDSQQMSLW
ncbi:DNA polymerase IV [Actinobacillus delphinicola]|uniref:DNA polymerase IV n=1 Tax=Actinobacillus delphinicola TaxID=51161 RepID=A0A448TVW3_9PAST|nr:DNA polymerase IV [Actinobacillus delphinicola]VEJ10072.1 DNA polymerase IV [Actinobacillus delphinicola]